MTDKADNYEDIVRGPRAETVKLGSTSVSTASVASMASPLLTPCCV